MAEDIDFFNYHRIASGKLKKRFLKKPNVSEASNEFEQLKNHLSRIECYPYAGFATIAKAKCEQSLFNPAGEVDSLIEAARFFLKADEEIDQMNCPNLHEHLECAVWCYNCAIKIYEDSKMPAFAGSTCLEIANFYYKSQRYEQALQHYKRAVMYFAEVPSQVVVTMNHVINCQIITRDFNSALATSMSAIKLIKEQGTYQADGVMPLGHYHNYMKEIEVTRLLLLLRVNQQPKTLSKEHSEVLQKYTWPDEENAGSNTLSKLLGEDLFIYLQSLIMALSSDDVDSMLEIQREIEPYLAVEQNVLLQRILNELLHPKGMGF